MRGFGFVAVAAAACASPAAVSPETPVSAVEVTEDGELKAVPERGMTEIDVNSAVRLTVDSTKAQVAMAEAVQVDASRLDALSSRTRKLRIAIAAQKAALGKLDERLRAPVPPSEVRASMIELGSLEGDALKALLSVASRDEANRLLALGPSVGYREATSLLSRESTDVQRELDQVLEKLGRVRWRMQATLITSRGPEPVHLDGYDSMASGAPKIIEKLAVPKDLSAKLKEARQAADELRDLETTRRRIEEVAEKRAGELRDRLSGIADDLDAVSKVLDRAQKAPWTTLKQGREPLAAMRALADRVRAVVEPCRAGFEQVASLRKAPSIQSVWAVADPESAIRRCMQQLVEEAPKVRDEAVDVVGKAKAMRASAASDALLTKALTDQARADLDEVIARAERTTLREAVAWWQSLSGAFNSAAKLRGAEFGSPEQLTDRSYRSIADTTIDLVRTPRQQGDLVYHRSAIVVDGSETTQWSSAPLRVVATGWHIDVSASVVFVRALEQQAGDSSYPAAPAATGAIHYRVPRAAGANRSGSFWNFLDPGLGLHLAYLDLGPKEESGATSAPSDPATELGVGVTVQLFGDVLQGGLAYDLQVERPYYFLGVGVQTLTAFGLTVPAGGK